MPEATSGGAAAPATRGAPTARAFRAYVRGIQAGPGCSSRRSRTRPCAEVREALALRERVIDFAVEAQGLDAAALQARFRASF